MSVYRVGYCPGCDTQIMVQNTDGRWNSFKPDFRVAALRFEDGHELITNLCATCLEAPDYQKILDALLHEESQAKLVPSKQEKLREKGIPVNLRRIR